MSFTRTRFLEKQLKLNQIGIPIIDFKVVYEGTGDNKGRIYVSEIPSEKFDITHDMLLSKGFEIKTIYNNLNYKISNKEEVKVLNSFLFKIYNLTQEELKVFFALPEVIEEEIKLEDILIYLKNATIYSGIRSEQELGEYYRETLGIPKGQDYLTDREYAYLAIRSGNYGITKYGVIEIIL